MRGRAPVFLTPDGRAVKLAATQPAAGPRKRAIATIVEQIGAMPRAYDVASLQ